ncbi:GntR family transcriptional regulator/MocR family aminotransferase [Neorhizobium galegae]|uniref:aminotransferase-like domain-containing protein n=1 Tax=Neorhizobium galegae TaxID=399 RepID=UPI0027897DD9|nr:PLP-dependent aminotransferase family protein [Neorhizobium galegae]MDQ0133832.1 GntR family transcriptional regulator/MocR family aminotransferase [Neorhizobium galegae]
MTRQGASSIAWDHVLTSLVTSEEKLTHATLAKGLSEWIDAGRLPRGARLPSTRVMAGKLGLGRNTVLFALSCLVENGYLDSRERSGIFIGASRQARTGDRSPSQINKGPDWEKRLPSSRLLPQSSAMTNAVRGSISLRFGEFDLSLFPTSHWRECERAASGLGEIAKWGRDMIDGDDVGLIEQIRLHVLPQSGIWARPDEILITVGAQEGRYLVSRVLARAGTHIGIENPCSLDLARTVQLSGAMAVGLTVDAQGVLPSEAMDACGAVFLTPGHQNPTTALLSAERRKEILKRADFNDFVVVEDTFETEFINERGGPRALKADDVSGRVIYIGTLSRLMAPGLRIGFIVAPSAFIDHVRMLRRLVHRHPPANNQRSLAIFIERGYYRRFVKQTTQILERRGQLLLSMARRDLPELTWHHQVGTSCFWGELPAGVDSDAVATEARRRGVLVEAGSHFFAVDGRSSNCLRLTVSGVKEDQIEKSVRVLAEAYRVTRSVSKEHILRQ